MVEGEALWNVLRMYSVIGQLLAGMFFYREARAHPRVEGKLGASFLIGVRVRQRCIIV